MSLQLAAQHLASKGRGPDTELVHMSMDEIKSLQSLAKAHGGSLTINPETGLAEAGFLSRILPMVAGAALTATGVGAPMAALLVGGGTGLATGSLKKGLMAGLGAYGGAGLAGGLAGAGASEAILQANPGLAPSEIAREMGTAGFTQPSFLDQASAGLQGLGKEAGRSAFMQNIGGLKGLAQYGGAAAAPLLFGGEPKAPPTRAASAPPVPLQFNANSMSPTPQPDVPVYGQMGQDFGRQQQYFNPSYTIAQQPTPVTPMPMMADGGPVENMSLRNQAEMMMANGGQMYAQGGLSHLGDYSDGGRLLKGPGDGVSDDIPAMIGSKQPARLANNEFVIPARIVSEIGNGSTEAGAKRLYAMMDRVQKARKKTIGKGKIAVDSKAHKELEKL